MSDRDNNLDLDALASEARAWVGRMASGEATSADTAALMLWRSLSSEHARALGEAVRLRRRVVAAGQELRSQPNARWLVSRPSRQSGGAIGRRAFIGGAVAASVAALAVRPPMGLWPSLPELLEELQADYRTRTGERKTVVIARGLAVELNTRTSLARHDDGGAYRLRLIAGEVAVDAQHPLRPAAILTPAGEAWVLNGQVGVRIQDREACVSCLAGDVAVTGSGGRQVSLRAGEQVVIGAAAAPTVTKVDLARAQAWRRGELIFTDQPLSEVVEELNRYRSGKIILARAALGRIPVNAVFRLDSIDNAVAQIREVSNATATSLPGGIVLLS